MNDLVQVLTTFHREVFLPDFERILGSSEQRLRDEMHGLFDALGQRMDRLESGCQMFVVGLKRVDGALDRVERQLDRVEGVLEARIAE